jgi:tetratricopeptide (TPR) repeat protein
LSYPEVEEVSPEFWKSHLQEAIRAILTALAGKSPTVFFLEDLHWADPSFVELLQRACLEIQQPAIVLCIYRPTFSLFSSHQASSIGKLYHEIHLKDLSLSDTQNMLESLLQTNSIPSDLKQLVQGKAEGNPFYLEELINSLIDSETLIRDNGNWKITKPITDSDISFSIQGLITGRLDRLEKEPRRVLQEASVIGRAFLYEIIKQVTELKERVDHSLSGLERLDLIRAKSLQPELEYIFKHALTQEVVYNGLLKKERQEIHERIALVIEKLFHDRLAEFYETLAFHYTQGKSIIKAIDYLVKSGEKSLARYSVEEAHQYFQKAFDILAPKEDKSEEEKNLLIEILNSWGYAYYYLGDAKTFCDLFLSYQDMAEAIKDKAKRGMFFVWLGIAIYLAGKMKVANAYLRKALEFGEESGNQKVVGYACTWLTWTCAELGYYKEGIDFGNRAQKIAKSFATDQYLYFKSCMGLCYISYFMGDTEKVFEGAKALLDYGKRHRNNRSMVFGHWAASFGYFLTGDMELAQKSSEKSVEVALDPFYSQFPKISLGMYHFFGGRVQEAKDVLQSAMVFFEKYGIGQLTEITSLFLSLIFIAKGDFAKGLKKLEGVQKTLINNQRATWHAQSEYILGKVYSEIATGPKPDLTTIAKNIGFLFKNVPQAGKKAEEHFAKAIELSKEIGATGFLGRPYLDLGLLYKARKKNDQAREMISKAIKVFKDREAKFYLNQANEVLESLND